MLTGIVSSEILMFLLGFSSVCTVYEVAKSSKSSKTAKLQKDVERAAKEITRKESGDE